MDHQQLVEFDKNATGFKSSAPAFFQNGQEQQPQQAAVSTECAEKVEAMLSTAVLHLADLWNMLTLEFSEGVAFDPDTALLTPVTEIPPVMLVAMKSKLENSLEWCQLARSRLTDITRSTSAASKQQQQQQQPLASPNYHPPSTVQPDLAPKTLWPVQPSFSPELRTYSFTTPS